MGILSGLTKSTEYCIKAQTSILTHDCRVLFKHMGASSSGFSAPNVSLPSVCSTWTPFGNPKELVRPSLLSSPDPQKRMAL